MKKICFVLLTVCLGYFPMFGIYAATKKISLNSEARYILQEKSDKSNLRRAFDTTAVYSLVAIGVASISGAIGLVYGINYKGPVFGAKYIFAHKMRSYGVPKVLNLAMALGFNYGLQLRNSSYARF